MMSDLRIATFSTFESMDKHLDSIDDWELQHYYLRITDNLARKDILVKTKDEWEELRVARERSHVWKPFEVFQQYHLGTPIAAGATVGADDHAIQLVDLGTHKVPVSVINPTHYQGYVMELQWLETMQYLPNFRDPACFKAAVELQVRKYLDRNGRKDKELQELEKAIWYLRFLAAYVKNGNKPIRVKDIESILNG
jgi:hypothetical protein